MRSHKLLLGMMVLLTSCAKPLLTASDYSNRYKLFDVSLSEFNGDYEIMTIDTLRRTLSASFMPDKRFHLGNLPDSDDKISIRVLDGHKIMMTLIDKNKIVRKRIIKFDLTNDYIEYRRSYFSPFWVIINGYENTIVRIGLLENGNLTMDISTLSIGLIGMIPFTGYETKEYNLIYARKSGVR